MNVGTWAWDYVNNEWCKIPAAVTTKRMTTTGQVASGARKLFWVSMNPSAADSEAVLIDSLTATGDTVFDMFHASRDHMHMVLNPPMIFATGIYLKTIDHMTSMIFGYV